MGKGKTDGLRVVNMFTMVLGMLCNSNFRIYLRVSRCSEGSAGSLPPIMFLNGHNVRPTSCTPCDRFRTPTMEHLEPWSPVCTRPTVNITYWFHHQFSITNSTYSYMEVCGMERTPVHILRYMGRTSNKIRC